MKLRITILIAIAAISTLIACSSMGEPERVAVDFATAFNKGDIEQAKNYCTEDARSMLSTLQVLLGDKLEAMAKTNPKITPEKAQISADGNSATVKIKTENALNIKTDEVEIERTSEMKLLKKDGKWLVDILQ